MTTIAIRGREIATDSATTLGTIVTGTVRKHAAYKGYVVVAAGGMLACATVFQWVEGGMKSGALDVSDDDFSALLVHPDGAVFQLGGSGLQVPIHAPFYALGSGREIALGAMAAGADPERAVQIACRLDGASREPVHVMRLGD